MNKCGSCEFWNESELSKPFGKCSKIEHDQECKVNDWEDEDDIRESSKQYRKEHKAVVKDVSGYYAALLTRDDFGCIEWKGKK